MKVPARNESFEAYYRSLYGVRWESLRESLLAERPGFAFSEGLTEPYFLDYASVLAARSVRLPAVFDGGEEPPLILDACAAPGGKSLVIAAGLPSVCRLLANELSADRRRRLSGVLDKYLDGEKRRRVTVSGFDAAAAGRRKTEHGRFAAVLVDAPCSSEAHVLRDSSALAAWTGARPRFLARRQWALLSSAFLLLRSGGSLVYATCALSGEENDGVVQRLLEKYGSSIVLDRPDFSEGEQTGFGRIMLPDVSGMGPMYVARFRKIQQDGC
ncbi:MAG: 16S rRNA methyltransferase [Treponema sp.]|jgi:16S rRNA (cytosine1407-C5)-methyltransferase|nr:16S rRNA methyltransferase [Treponema sp.]